MTATAARPPTATPSASRRPANCFDALRLIAALCVVVQHAVMHLGAPFLWYRPGSPWWFFDGVMAFFILSGSMVYASAERCKQAGRPILDYLRNRVLRIAPAIYVYVTVTAVALIAIGVIRPAEAASMGFLGWLLSNVILLPVYHPALLASFGTGVVNGSLWTIPVEFGFYLLVPVLLWGAGKIGTIRMAMGVFLAGVAGVVVLGVAEAVAPSGLAVKLFAVSPLPWLGYFAIGILISRLWPTMPQKGNLALFSVVLYTALSSVRGYAPTEVSGVFAAASAVPLAYVLFWVGHHGPAILRTATEKIGDLSFGVYIWHMPVVNLLIWAGLPKTTPAHTQVVLALGMSLALACASWHLVEKPALKLKRYSSGFSPKPARGGKG